LQYNGCPLYGPLFTVYYLGQQEKYRLIIQHLLFHTKQVTGNGKNAGTIQLQPQDYALDEVVVKAERPFVKVENGRLGYNLAVLSEKQVVNNAYEALMRLPGVIAGYLLRMK